MLTVRSWRAITACASSALMPTASMAPPEGACSCMQRPRCTMTSRALLQSENTGDASRGVFAHAVADDRGGLHAPRFPKFRQRHLHGENGRLRNIRALNARLGFRARQFLEQRKTRERFHRFRAGFHRPAEDRLVPHQLAAHAPPLRALTAHDEDDASRFFQARGEGGAQLGARLSGGESAEFLRQLGDRTSRQREPVRVVIAPRAEHVSEIRELRRNRLCHSTSPGPPATRPTPGRTL